MLIPLVVFLALPAHAATPISGCGSTVTGDAELTANIDCTGSEDPAVILSKGSLALNGYTITGSAIGVKCLRKCSVTGPGTISEAEFGISAYGKLTVTDVGIDHSEYVGIQCFRNCRVVGGSLTNSGDPQNPDIGGGEGIRSTGVLKLDGVTIANNGYGALARSYPKHHGRLEARNTVFSGNGIGAVADKGAKITDSSATGNLVAGILIGDFLYAEPCPDSPGTVKLKNTIVTGNGGGDGCGMTRACADLMTCRVPKLDALSTCGTSYANESGLPGTDWDVCSGD
jgi:hypothetical protein